MDFRCTEWTSVKDLINKMKLFAIEKTGTDTVPKEIERKWLVKDKDKLLEHLQKTYKCISHKNVTSGYLSIDPEIRYAGICNLVTDEMQYKLTYKSGEGLVRDELEVTVDFSTSIQLAKAIRSIRGIKAYGDSIFIIKDFYVFDLNGKKLHVSIVDPPKGFVYMEIEFKSEEKANEYELPHDVMKFVKKDVTMDERYKMKQYWARTRLPKQY